MRANVSSGANVACKDNDHNLTISPLNNTRTTNQPTTTQEPAFPALTWRDCFARSHCSPYYYSPAVGNHSAEPPDWSWQASYSQPVNQTLGPPASPPARKPARRLQQLNDGRPPPTCSQSAELAKSSLAPCLASSSAASNYFLALAMSEPLFTLLDSSRARSAPCCRVIVFAWLCLPRALGNC